MYIIDNGSTQWSNLHRTIVDLPVTLKTLYNPPISSLASLQPLWDEVEDLIETTPGRIRAYGARWSLSSAGSADSNGVMLETANLNQVFRMNTYLHSNYSGSADTIRYFQSGISVRAVNDFLGSRGYALKTSGASDGQTLAGAISTGTHGSAFNVGSMQEAVVGIHVLCGKGRNYWVERSSYPVGNQQLIDALGATLMSDDDVFNALLVSFGSMGIIVGYALEFEPVYTLELYRERVSHADAAAFLTQLISPASELNTSAIELIFPAIGKNPQDLHHIEVDVNPHDSTAAFVSIMYRSSDMTEVPFCDASGVPGNETITIIGDTVNALGDVFGAWLTGTLIPLFSSTISGQFQVCKPFVRLPRGKMFAPTTATGGIMSVELGIAHTDAVKALNILTTLNSSTPFAGAFAFRFVKQTQATLGFTAFPVSCCIELPGVGMTDTEEFYAQVFAGFESASITFTLHWGQMNDYAFGGDAKVRSRWGDTAVNSWITARERLLPTKQVRDRFSNDLLEHCGLNPTVSPAGNAAVIAGVLDS